MNWIDGRERKKKKNYMMTSVMMYIGSLHRRELMMTYLLVFANTKESIPLRCHSEVILD